MRNHDKLTRGGIYRSRNGVIFGVCRGLAEVSLHGGSKTNLTPRVEENGVQRPQFSFHFNID